jgi:hypothetical protein
LAGTKEVVVDTELNSIRFQRNVRGMPMRAFLRWIVPLTIAWLPAAALGQAVEAETAGDTPVADAPEADTSDSAEAHDTKPEALPADSDEQIAALNRQVETLNQRVETLEKEKERLDEVEARMDNLDLAEIEKIAEKERELKVYGFLSVLWEKHIFPKNSTQKGLVNDKHYFSVARWNMYLEKKLTDSFRFLSEVRFLFQPYGEDYWSYNSSGPMGETEFERADTRATDLFDAYNFDWGGIAIERAWIEYNPIDYFGVRAGMFLTPYGLWNEDHSPTVRIPTHRPFYITAALLPETQTGLHLFGRVFPSNNTHIDYGLTLSNGRGPTAKLYDLDNNKALGLKLAFTYRGPILLSFGTYFYMGDYTDTVRNFEVTPDGKFKYSMDAVDQYAEKNMSYFLKLEWGGVTLQGEYTRGMIKYMDDGRPGMADMMTGTMHYNPDHTKDGAYALLAYRLPFDAVDISPYFIYDYSNPSKWTMAPMGHTFSGGVNWRIIPPLVWKVEGFYHIETGDRFEGNNNYSMVSSQLAVAY